MTFEPYNIFWRAFTGPQADLSVGDASARRFSPGISPIAAFADPAAADLAPLRPHWTVGERLFIADWSGPLPDDFALEFHGHMLCMVFEGQMPDPRIPTIRRLGPDDVPAMTALAALTRPGPFGPRTIELGHFYGVFDGDALVAMAGERSRAEGCREVSAVCTDPRYQGRGLARQLVDTVLYGIQARGETPYLHVLSTNEGAVRLYGKMGFAVRGEPSVRVVNRLR